MKPSSFKFLISLIIALLSTLKKSAKSVSENGNSNVLDRFRVDNIEKYPNNLSLIVLFVNTSILVFKFVTLFTTILQNFSDNNW